MDLAREFYRTRRDIITTLVKTPKGLHAYFSGQLHNAQKGTFDVRGVGGYVVGAGSVVDGKRYAFVPGHELVSIDQLKPFPEDFIPERKEDDRRPVEADDDLARIFRARAWLKKRDPAISGQRGHLQMIKTCRAMFAMFGLTEDQAFPLILEYNDRCVPPFSDKELRHKLADAAKKGVQS
jgi:hypothetical protein